MEMLLLVFLLASLDKNPPLKESLKNFLGFYRENREFITSILQQSAPGDAAPAAEEQKKSRPKESDSLNVLEEYLKRCAV